MEPRAGPRGPAQRHDVQGILRPSRRRRACSGNFRAGRYRRRPRPAPAALTDAWRPRSAPCSRRPHPPAVRAAAHRGRRAASAAAQRPALPAQPVPRPEHGRDRATSSTPAAGPATRSRCPSPPAAGVARLADRMVSCARVSASRFCKIRESSTTLNIRLCRGRTSPSSTVPAATRSPRSARSTARSSTLLYSVRFCQMASIDILASGWTTDMSSACRIFSLASRISASLRFSCRCTAASPDITMLRA